MKISFAICTHNEGDYIRQLLNRLTNFIVRDKSGVEYEIVIVDDYSTDAETVNILQQFSANTIQFSHKLDNDYSTHKNFMNSKCTGDWILNLDADEWVTDDFLGALQEIVEANPDIEAYWIPRINTVDGLTLDHVRMWGWVLTPMDEFRKIKVIDSNSEEYKLLKNYNFIIHEENDVVTFFEPIVSYPDFQMRLYKNDSKIQWKNKVHERLYGFNNFGMFPQHELSLAIRHFKEITRQEAQNAFYETLQK